MVPFVSDPEVRTTARPIPTVSLSEKAAGYRREVRRRFESPEGLCLYRKFDPPLPGPRPRYGSLADAAIWTGCLLGADSLAYAATGDPQHLADARRVLNGLLLLHDVTGVPGLIARSYSREPSGIGPGFRPHKWEPGAAPYGDYAWRRDASKDQVCGFVFGLTLAARHLTDEERDRIRPVAVALARHLIRNDWQLIGVDGNRTRFGDLQPYRVGVPIGVNALISLSALRLARALAPGDRAIARGYEDLLDAGALEAAYWAKVQAFGITNHNNDNMALLATYALLEGFPDPKLEKGLLKGLERTWSYVSRERNSLFTFIRTSCSGVRDKKALREARESLRAFPLQKRLWGRDLRGRKDLLWAPLPNRKGTPKARRALPMELRAMTSFVWKSCPYALVAYPGERGRIRHAGVDYLLAYWLGRKHGLVGSSQ